MRQRLPFSTWQLVIVVTTILIVLTWQARIIKNNWRYARGYEQEWVAGSLLDGYGYSFDPATAWLGPYGYGNAYTLTAWVDPLYTSVIAAVMKLSAEYGRLILALLNVLWLGASGVMIFLLVGEILDYQFGIYASLLFLIVEACRRDVVLYLGNAALAGSLYCLSAYLLLRCLKNPSLTNCIFLGAVISVANLNHAGSLLLAPLSALVIGSSIGIRKITAWRNSIVVLVTAASLLTPWILRNYVVFHHFVPIRSGFGYQLYIGNPGLARTFTPGLKFDVLAHEPPWTANGPLQSLLLLRNLEYDRALRNHSIQVIRETSSAEYQSYNEVERDHVFLARSLAFIRAEPLLALKMMFWKAIAFLTYWKFDLSLVSIAAIAGGLLMIKDVRVAGLMLIVAGYMVPFILSMPLYYRYRSPIEPMLFVLAGLFLGICLQRATPLWNEIKGWLRSHVRYIIKQPNFHLK